ncbi:hypothetical protein HK101_004439, partial [Irineochytrium annulatum]
MGDVDDDAPRAPDALVLPVLTALVSLIPVSGLATSIYDRLYFSNLDLGTPQKTAKEVLRRPASHLAARMYLHLSRALSLAHWLALLMALLPSPNIFSALRAASAREQLERQSSWTWLEAGSWESWDVMGSGWGDGARGEGGWLLAVDTVALWAAWGVVVVSGDEAVGLM